MVVRVQGRAGSQDAGPAGGGQCLGKVGARLLLVGATALTVANCGHSPSAGGRHKSEIKYGVASSPRVIPEGQPIPKGGGRETLGRPYVVAGRTYVPRPGRGYDREGWASWYGTAFHGRLTANGEIFDRESIAAAHPTLPLPSYVRVTNLVNDRSMIVRVNDRGPYERDRIIDVSERAADALGFRQKGTGRVRVEYVGKASLNGSDDRKLLATLRTDGGPAALGGGRQQPVMVASLSPRPSTHAEDDPPRRAQAAARPVRGALPEYVDNRRPGARPPSARSTVVAVAESEARRPLDIRPPSRPDLDGIYFVDPKSGAARSRSDPFPALRRDATVSLRGSPSR